MAPHGEDRKRQEDYERGERQWEPPAVSAARSGSGRKFRSHQERLSHPRGRLSNDVCPSGLCKSPQLPPLQWFRTPTSLTAPRPAPILK
jgi:hypothetical protein